VYVPADLDLVLRLDLRRYREVVGADSEPSLGRLWSSFVLDSQELSKSTAWLVPVLQSTDTLWLGCRIGQAGCRDFVLVLRGRFASSRVAYQFGGEREKRDLGAGWLSLDLEAAGRTSAARLYWRSPELAILVSPMEIDSAERSVEQSRDGTRLEPSEDGLLSLVVRSKALATNLRERSPKAADWLDQSERVELRLEPSVGATAATFCVSFRDAPQAERSAQAFRMLVSGFSAFDRRINVKNVDVQVLHSDVMLRISFPTANEAEPAGTGEVAPR
jgi:hypothetical protein